MFSPSRINSATFAHIHWMTIVRPSYYGFSCNITFKIFTARNKLCNLQDLRIREVGSHRSHLAWDWNSKPIKLTERGERGERVWWYRYQHLMRWENSRLISRVVGFWCENSEHDLPTIAFSQLWLAGLWSVRRVRLHWVSATVHTPVHSSPSPPPGHSSSLTTSSRRS